jgi:hypothetical protein
LIDVGVLTMGTFTNINSTSIVGTPPVLQAIASAVDTSYHLTSTNATGVYIGQFDLQDMPADFGTMHSLSVRLRYYQSGLSNNNWNSLRARVFRSNGTTPLTDWATLASVAAPGIRNTTATNSGVITFTGLDTTADKSVWDGAVVHIEYDITRNKAGDTYSARVSAGELTGQYNAAGARRAGGNMIMLFFE